MADRLAGPGAAETEISCRQRLGIGIGEKAIPVDPKTRRALLSENRDMVYFIGPE